MSTLLLIDGNALIHRAAYFMPRSMQNDKGFPTWAIKGFLNLLFSEINKTKPTHVSIFFDHKSKKRAQLSGGTYKANRGKVLDDPEKELERKQLRQQFKPIRQIVKSLGFHVCRVKDIEADDLIGAYAKQIASKEEVKILILARDKDFNQLITDKINVLDTWSGKYTLRDKQYVVDRYGVKPSQFAAYLALVGDTADNIKKVKGIGPKTASHLLKKHKKLKFVLPEMKASERKIIKLAYSLTKIDCNIVDAPKLDALVRGKTKKSYKKLVAEYQINSKKI